MSATTMPCKQNWARQSLVQVRAPQFCKPVISVRLHVCQAIIPKLEEWFPSLTASDWIDCSILSHAKNLQQRSPSSKQQCQLGAWSTMTMIYADSIWLTTFHQNSPCGYWLAANCMGRNASQCLLRPSSWATQFRHGERAFLLYIFHVAPQPDENQKRLNQRQVVRCHFGSRLSAKREQHQNHLKKNSVQWENVH